MSAIGNAQTGATHTILTETDPAWVDVQETRWIDRGAAFLWLSERDGWRHLYEVSRDGRNVRLVTPGAFDVLSVAAVVESVGLHRSVTRERDAALPVPRPHRRVGSDAAYLPCGRAGNP